MRCFKCLKEVPPGTEVCPHCGQVLIPKANKQGKERNNLSSTQVKQKEYKIGDTIKDRYEVRAVLGKKGTGFTYKVRDKEKKKIFILKHIHSFLITSDDAKNLFFDIVKKLISLNLSEIAAIQEFGEDEGVVYLVTENVEGLTLRKLLDVRKEMKQFFKGEELESILTQVCKVLITAHNNGLLHGDLKPENIFILPNGIKITELGITTVFSPLDFTSIQQDLGDAYKYIAPEVVIGGALSKASDIYSLGVIVYEMLTGIIPTGIVHPLTEYNAELPQGINDVVLKALAQDPEQRTQYISEFYKGILTSFGLKPAEFEEKPWIIKQTQEAEQGEQAGTLQTEIDEELLMYIDKGPTTSTPEPDKRVVAPKEETPQPEVKTVIEEKPQPEIPIISETEQEKAVSPEQPVIETRLTVEEVQQPSEQAKPEQAVVEPQTIEEEAKEAKVTEKEPIKEPVKEETAPVQELPIQENIASQKESAQPSEKLIEQKPPEEETNLAEIARHLESVAQEIQKPGIKETKPVEQKVEKPAVPLIETQKPITEQPSSQEVKPTVAAQPSQVQTTAPIKLEEKKKSLLPVITGVGIVAIGLLAVVAWFLLKGSPKQATPTLPITANKPAESFTKPTQVEASHVSETVAVVKPPVEKPHVTEQEKVERKVEKPKQEKRLVAVAPKQLPKCPDGMVYIPTGYFLMGSSPSDPLRDFSEKPNVRVYVKAFCIDKYEYPDKEGYLPKVNVNFYTAERLCADEGKRLCKEEEWEKACKGPSDLKYPYGNVWNASKCNTQNSDGTSRSIEPSGTYKGCESGYGVYDMSGNVMEWTNSVFSSEDTADKVVKGGSFTKPDWATRCAYRYNMLPHSTSNEVGFRCCKAPER